MTLMLASVADAAEAEVALIEGADILDLKDPAAAPLGALDPAAIRAVTAAIGKRRPVSAVAGNLVSPAELAAAAKEIAAAGVDYVKVGLFPGETGALIDALKPIAAKTKLIGVLFADQGADFALIPRLQAAGFKGVMLDTAGKDGARLINHLDIAALQRFVDLAHAAGLIAGLAGSLEAPDIARLLPISPDLLGFRGALCSGKDRATKIDAAQVRLIRDLIPRENTAADLGDEFKVDWRLLSARGYAPGRDEAIETDRVFVHDLVLSVSIGAYDFERNKTQRVRFNIDADVRRAGHLAEDMRDVFSYDVIVDAIRLVFSRGHVDLVETVAERVADALLAHPRLVAIKVRVEKLDVIDGSVGIEISRARVSQAGKLHQLFADLAAKSGG
ncbi:MAG: (5-formylfuran-3-yl)methyl phosphate synthase [Pseudomonadota bacterium]